MDANSRLSWLLATTRLLSPATRNTSRQEFIGHVRSAGLQVDATRISRWELGTTAVSDSCLEVYERLTERPAGCLAAARTVLAQSHDQPRPTPGSESSDVDIDAVLTSLDTDPPDGGGWLRLSAELTSFERVYLDPRTWSKIGNCLIAELALTSGIEHTTRLAAASTFIAHPAGRRHLTLSVGRFVTDPDVQFVSPVLGLLRRVPDPAAGELVLRLLRHGNPLLRHAAATAAPGLRAAQRFPDGADVFLEQSVRSGLGRGTDLVRRVAALDLLTYLPDDAQERVLADVKDVRTRRRIQHVVESYELVEPRHTRSVCETLANAVERRVQRDHADPDRMLRLLLREALFHVRSDRRRMAASLLSASLYADPLAHELLATSSAESMTSAMRWHLLGQLGGCLQRREVAAAAAGESRPGLRSLAWLALGFAQGELDDDVSSLLHELVERPQVPSGERHAALLVLGMSAHPRIDDLAGHEAREIAGAAQWWRRIAPQLTTLRR